MESERKLRFIEDEIKRREEFKIIMEIKRMTDQELKLNRRKCINKREEEYKRMGWLR